MNLSLSFLLWSFEGGVFFILIIRFFFSHFIPSPHLSGLYGVRPGDEAFKLARNNAAQMRALSSGVAGCVSSASGPVPSSSVLSLDTCVDSRIRGIPGTGLEGPQCDVEINECVRGTSDCDPNAACIDLNAASGGWACECRHGFEPVVVVVEGKEGKSEQRSPQCSPTGTLEELSTKTYALGANGRIACSGALLPWPLTAVGGGRDPAAARVEELDSTAAASASVRVEPWVAVTLSQCLQACSIFSEEAAKEAAKEAAAAAKNSTSKNSCEAAEFNSVRGRCRLRGRGARSDELCKSPRETHAEADQSLVEKEYDEGMFEAYFRRR